MSTVAGVAFLSWSQNVKALGGTPTAWPFQSGLYAKFHGRPAARYAGRVYAALANARRVDAGAPTQTTNNGAFVYVLAPDAVATAAPPDQMTLWQRAENAAFTQGDRVADAVGLPTLKGLEAVLQKSLLLIVGLAAVGIFLMTRRGSR